MRFQLGEPNRGRDIVVDIRWGDQTLKTPCNVVFIHFVIFMQTSLLLINFWLERLTITHKCSVYAAVLLF